ncbi:hypothetical protein ACOMHN_018753 [Nucella lapillus]
MPWKEAGGVLSSPTGHPKPAYPSESDVIVTHTSNDQTEAAMSRTVKPTQQEKEASDPSCDGSVARKQLEQKIHSFLSIPEEDTKQALSVADKHPDLQDDFLHLVDILHKSVKSNPEEFVRQLNCIKGPDQVSVSLAGKDFIDFLALIGGAKATVEVYAGQLKSMGITHVTDKLLNDEVEEQHQTAMYVIVLMRHFWENATDCSLVFGGRLAETSVISCFVMDLKNLEENFLANSQVFDGSLTLLHNCARSRETKQKFHDIGLVQLLTPFLDREEKEIKLLSLLTLSYIIDEEDSHLLFADASDFDFLLEAVSCAWNDVHHRDLNGYTLEELLQGLGNLTQNDDNKKLLMEKDVLKLLEPILDSGSEVEKQEAAHIVWNMAFNKENRTKMEKDKELIDRLERLKGSDCIEVANAAKGALWVLNMDKRVQRDRQLNWGTASSSSALPSPSAHGLPTLPYPLVPSPAGGGQRGHVMISYQWSNQKVIMEICNSLRSRGFHVWMDVDNISGSTLQAMAEAVEKAEAVLMCMSSRYKDSPNCRTEAEYAFQLMRPIIPLLMERSYQPDGWLGILKGSKLFFDFSGKYPYEKKIEDLVKELGHRGRIETVEVDGPIAAEKARPVASTPRKCVSSWSQKDVHDWLNKHHLSGCTRLQSLTGENLHFLQKLSHRAPEFFFSYVKQDLGLKSLNDLMHLNDAIDRLR